MVTLTSRTDTVRDRSSQLDGLTQNAASGFNDARQLMAKAGETNAQAVNDATNGATGDGQTTAESQPTPKTPTVTGAAATANGVQNVSTKGGPAQLITVNGNQLLVGKDGETKQGPFTKEEIEAAELTKPATDKDKAQIAGFVDTLKRAMADAKQGGTQGAGDTGATNGAAGQGLAKAPVALGSGALVETKDGKTYYMGAKGHFELMMPEMAKGLGEIAKLKPEAQAKALADAKVNLSEFDATEATTEDKALLASLKGGATQKAPEVPEKPAPAVGDAIKWGEGIKGDKSGKGANDPKLAWVGDPTTGKQVLLTQNDDGTITMQGKAGKPITMPAGTTRADVIAKLRDKDVGDRAYVLGDKIGDTVSEQPQTKETLQDKQQNNKTSLNTNNSASQGTNRLPKIASTDAEYQQQQTPENQAALKRAYDAGNKETIVIPSTASKGKSDLSVTVVKIGNNDYITNIQGKGFIRTGINVPGKDSTKDPLEGAIESTR